MNIHDRVLEDYELGLLAVRQGRFMAADHYFLRAVKRAYELRGLEGKIEAARHMAHIYTDQGMVRMAARHSTRALKLMERSGEADSARYRELSRKYRDLCRINLDVALQGLGIDASGTGPVPRTEAHCSLVLGVLNSLSQGGPPTPDACAHAVRALNDQGCATGRGEPWTVAAILRLCSIDMLD